MALRGIGGLVRFALIFTTTLLAAASAFAEPELPVVHSRSDDVIGKPDGNKTFNLNTTSPFRHRPGTFQSSKSAASKEFYFEQKVSPKGYAARAFSGTKTAWMGDFKFATKDAPTKDAREVTKTAAVKTAPVKDAREATKTAATRELADAHRPYLGKEAAKLNTPIDMNNQPRWTNDLKQLKSIEDVKALLNKN